MNDYREQIEKLEHELAALKARTNDVTPVSALPKNTKPRIIVVDDFFDYPHLVRERALASDLQPHPDYHKGIRSAGFPIAREIAVAFEAILGRKVAGPGNYSCFQACVAGDQLVYHSDTQQYAATVYLTPGAPPETGLSTYASRTSGVRSSEEITTEDEERETYGGKLLDRTAWREIDRIGNVFNRLVIWDARLIHGATEYFGTCAADGRLFQMFFFDVAE